MEAGVKPRFIEFDGSVPLINFIVSLNLHRRHLDESQRGMVGERIKHLFEEEARKNMSLGGQGLANLPKVHSRDQAAGTVNVSPRTVEQAGYAESDQALRSCGTSGNTA